MSRMLPRHHEPIVAIATAPGRAAVGIVRVSGRDLRALIEALCGRSLAPRHATFGGNAKIFDYFHRQTRGMENGMAYHFVIGNGSDSGDGQIEVGSRWLQQKQGGHLASESLNEIAIGICLVGDFSTHRIGPRQTASLIELVQYLRRLQPDSKLKFRLHREINTKPTECPGKLFPSSAIHEILD
jgi:hypothetical protein